MKFEITGKSGYLIYKCRNCNESFDVKVFTVDDEFGSIVLGKIAGLHQIHDCDEYCTGLADLVAYTYEDEGEK